MGFSLGHSPIKLHHISFNELKAVRYGIESFLSELKRRRFLLYEDKQIVVGVLTHLTSRSLAMMSKLRKLFLLIDEHDISIRMRYIRSSENVWADRLSREADNADW